MKSFKDTIQNNLLVHALVLFLFSFILYSNTLNHQFNLDDHYILSIINNSNGSLWNIIQSPYHLDDYRPVTLISFYLDQKIWGGLEPERMHFTNVLLYSLLCVLVYYFVVITLPNNSRLFALSVSLLFVSLPVHTEVVNSLKNRDNILSMLFMLLSFICLVKSYFNFKIPTILAGIIFFALAYFSKIDSIVMPVIFIIYILIFGKVKLKKLGFLVLLIFIVIKIRGFALDSVTSDSVLKSAVTFTENPLVDNFIFTNKLSQLIQTYFAYISMMLNPDFNGFYFGYDMVPLKNLISPEIITKALFLIGLLILSVVMYKRNKFILFGYLFFLASLFYAGNFFVPVAGIIANRYAFIASLGFCVFAVALIYELIILSKEKTKNQIFVNNYSLISLATVIVISLIFSSYTYSRNNDWKDLFTLIRADMPKLKNSFQANRIAMSNVLFAGINTKENKTLREALIKEGLQYGLNAQSLYKKDPDVNEKVGLAYQNLGNWKAAKSSYLLNSDTENRSFVAWENLGDIYFTYEQKYDSAAWCFKNVIKIAPKNDSPYFKYLNAGYRNGDKETVYSYFTYLEKIEPNNWIPSQCLGYYYLFEKDSLKGMQYIKKSFDKGFKDPPTADYVREKLIKFGDTKSAEEMKAYLN